MRTAVLLAALLGALTVSTATARGLAEDGAQAAGVAATAACREDAECAPLLEAFEDITVAARLDTACAVLPAKDGLRLAAAAELAREGLEALTGPALPGATAAGLEEVVAIVDCGKAVRDQVFDAFLQHVNVVQ